MTIWILAVILLASLAGLGFRQGAIRVAFSFLGIIFGALLAVPLGRILAKVFVVFGIKDPLISWALGPLLVFILISLAFKAIALVVHQKVDVYYKYRTGDLRLALWERLNHRLGLCLGILNGAAYLILLVFVIYLPSYATYQVASGDKDPKWMRLLNQMGSDLHKTGMAKVARSLDRVPQVDYDMVDLGALLYHNPLCQARLARYPGFFRLGERPELQALATDQSFTTMWQQREPIMNFLDHGGVLAIRKNPAVLNVIWTTVAKDRDDLLGYLNTGRSSKYDPEKLLGRWNFNVNSAINLMRRARPNIPSTEMQKVKKWMVATFSKTSMVARPDESVTLKNVPQLKFSAGAMSAADQTLQGQWKDLDGGKYQLSFSGTDLPATVEGDRLTIKAEGMDMVFDRED